MSDTTGVRVVVRRCHGCRRPAHRAGDTGEPGRRLFDHEALDVVPVPQPQPKLGEQVEAAAAGEEAGADAVVEQGLAFERSAADAFVAGEHHKAGFRTCAPSTTLRRSCHQWTIPKPVNATPPRSPRPEPATGPGDTAQHPRAGGGRGSAGAVQLDSCSTPVAARRPPRAGDLRPVRRDPRAPHKVVERDRQPVVEPAASRSAGRAPQRGRVVMLVDLIG